MLYAGIQMLLYREPVKHHHKVHRLGGVLAGRREEKVPYVTAFTPSMHS